MRVGRSLAALLFALPALLPATLRAGELDATVTFDTRHVQGTGNEATFEALRRAGQKLPCKVRILKKEDQF